MTSQTAWLMESRRGAPKSDKEHFRRPIVGERARIERGGVSMERHEPLRGCQWDLGVSKLAHCERKDPLRDDRLSDGTGRCPLQRIKGDFCRICFAASTEVLHQLGQLVSCCLPSLALFPFALQQGECLAKQATGRIFRIFVRR